MTHIIIGLIESSYYSPIIYLTIVPILVQYFINLYGMKPAKIKEIFMCVEIPIKKYENINWILRRNTINTVGNRKTFAKYCWKWVSIQMENWKQLRNWNVANIKTIISNISGYSEYSQFKKKSVFGETIDEWRFLCQPWEIWIQPTSWIHQKPMSTIRAGIRRFAPHCVHTIFRELGTLRLYSKCVNGNP